jgi:hypothetical protein
MAVNPQRHRRFLPPEIAETSTRLLDKDRQFEQLRTCPHCHWSEQLGPTRWKCRRFPPVVNPSRPGETMFPIMGEKDWCGEHQQ